MYLDSAYLAKYHVNEPDATSVRKLVRMAASVSSSASALIEVTCVFERPVREGSLTEAKGRELIDVFRSHVAAEIWNLVPVTNTLLRNTAALVRSLPPMVPLRAGDAIHIATALDLGEPEIWTNDRHLLGAATHCGIAGRSVC